MKEELQKLINKYPNDFELGKMLRRYILCEIEDVNDSVKELVDPEFRDFFNKNLS